MIALKHKIARPYIVLIIAIPLFIIVLFNISIRYFSGLQAQHELREVYRIFQKKSPPHLPRVAKLYRAKDFALATELILFFPNGELVNFEHFSEITLDENTARAAYATIKQKADGEIVRFTYERTPYYAMKIQTNIRNKPIFAIYISHGTFSKSFVSFINKVLICISLLVTMVALGISRKVSTSLVNPLQHIITCIKNSTFSGPIVIPSTTNILEINTLSHEINQMGKRIYAYNQEQKSFLHNASHELRTPLMSIQGYAEGIEQKIFADNAQAASIIKDETKRLATLVDELLILSRLEGANERIAFKQVSLKNALQDHIPILYGYALKNEKSIWVEFIEDSTIYIDEERFYQAVSNIVSNAIRFAKQNITMRIYQAKNQAILEIEDDGDGVATKDLPHIFEKFYRGKNGNFGLGLSISKSAIQSMNGSLHVKNGSQGAIFTIIFPLNHN